MVTSKDQGDEEEAARNIKGNAQREVGREFEKCGTLEAE